MARARNIKPGFYTNEDLAECSVWARYIFPGLWMMADREGRLEYRPKKIKGELLRFDEQAAEPLLEELQRWGFIEIYEVGGRKLIQIQTFSKHQNPHHREAESDLPPPSSPRLTPVANPSKPEAFDACQGGKAQGEPEAKPGFQSEDSTCQGGQAVLIPDSGFSDSLIPDSGRTEAGLPPANARPSELSAAMRKHSIEAQPGDPRIIAAAEAGISVETIEAACAEAKASDPTGRIKAGFVIAIAQRWTADAAKPRAVSRPRTQQRSYHDERAETIAGLTGRSRNHEHDDNIIDIPSAAVARLAG